MAKQRVSAGIVAYRFRGKELQVYLAHPGGPFFANRDEGAWTIPKGEVEPNEELLATAIREFQEEIGIPLDPTQDYIPLGSIRQKGGKVVHAWGVEGDWDDTKPIRSNTFKCEWPPNSGRFKNYPEVDRAEFFSIAEACLKIKETQIPLLERLQEELRRAKG